MLTFDFSLCPRRKEEKQQLFPATGRCRNGAQSPLFAPAFVVVVVENGERKVLAILLETFGFWTRLGEPGFFSELGLGLGFLLEAEPGNLFTSHFPPTFCF